MYTACHQKIVQPLVPQSEDVSSCVQFYHQCYRHVLPYVFHSKNHLYHHQFKLMDQHRYHDIHNHVYNHMDQHCYHRFYHHVYHHECDHVYLAMGGTI